MSQEMDTQIEMIAEDDEDEDNDKKVLLEHRQTREEQSWLQSCCRTCMILAAMVVFVLMLVQLWSNYGEYIETRVMAPSLVGLGEYRYGSYGSTDKLKEFMLRYHSWENGVLHLNLTQPSVPLVDTNPLLSYSWGESCLRIETGNVSQLQVFVWSM